MDHDVIIVGAGSSGAALAARLTEGPTREVLLLEAGHDYTAVDEMPDDILDSRWVSLTNHDWGFRAHACGGRLIEFPRGKVVGGSSAVNATLAIRGAPADFDRWAEAGNDEWSWEKCLPFFRKLENDQDFGGEFHGNDGPIPIVRFKDDELVPLQHAFLDAALKRGHPFMADHNAPDSTGAGPWAMNRIGSTRISTAYAYLAPIRDRVNLTVQGNTLVRRVIFEGSRAVGVEVERRGGTTVIHGEEIVLSAGAILSPAILWRSGVGPAAELRRIDIPVILDQPGVGENLMDHPVPVVACIPKAGVCDREQTLVQTLLRYTSGGSADENDVMIVLTSWIDLTQIPAMQEAFGVPMIFALVPVLELPVSRGSVRLNAADPTAAPEIDLNYFSDREGTDMKRMVEAVRISWEIIHSPAIHRHAERVAILDEVTIKDDAAVADFVRSVSATGYHPVGTCRMGTEASGAVVDQYLRVHGLEKIRVADASIMPTIPRANTNLTAIMIGERAATFMRSVSG